MRRQKVIVGIEKRDVAAAREIDAGVTCRTTAAIRLRMETDAGIADLLDNASRIVARTVIDDDDLEILFAL